MKEAVLRLYDELLELAEAQKRALEEERVDEMLDIQERRRGIVEEIQDLDGQRTAGLLSGRKGCETGKKLQHIEKTIEKILSIDMDIKRAVNNNLNSISGKLGSINKIKTFLHSAAPRQSGKNLSVSA